MASSLFASVSGLRAHQTMLDTVGNNLANVNTVGYKGGRTRFADLLYQTIAQATGASNASVGGTNPLQTGFGAKVNAIDTDLKQGSLQTTGGDLDIALQGNGFFVLNNGIQDVYTRAGAFQVDESNFLVDPTTGFRVQRFGSVGEGDAVSSAFQTPGDNSIRIPSGQGIPGKATSLITLQGNLSANASGPLQETLTTSTPLESGGVPATAATLLNALDDNIVPYVAGDVINIQGVDADGSVVNTSFTVGPATTVGNLVNAIDAAFAQSTATLDANGNIILQADNAGPASMSLTLTDQATNTGFSNFPAHAFALTTDGKNGDTVTTGIQVFDTQGTPHSLTVTFTKQGPNTWDISISIPASEGTILDGQVGGITFNTDGSFQAVTGVGLDDADVSIQFTGIPVTQTINFGFGTSGAFDGLTGFGGPSSAAATGQDGFAAGFLSSLSIGKDGLISGVFTNGRTLPIAQLAIALFANPAGLNREGDTYFSLSSNSGSALIAVGGVGGRGTIQQGALESSNIDVAQEFTQLIIAQRGFQVNARTITVSDQVLQELAGLIR
jgi:flagellar hook protein FlgE